MTPRPPVRMCARCERTTDAPVLVHEVHAATGPGFNVYACGECAASYPPAVDVLELLELAAAPVRRSPSRLTLRVYKVNSDGDVIEDRGEVEIVADDDDAHRLLSGG
ncbi:hypothetical protein [Streptomyces longisporoflavus]|uniref:Uncharacterized protein n=1 Tax=Streptomyces longisporoflavus TaxID=28044 RepID=A0ABW7QSD0_9ACTN